MRIFVKIKSSYRYNTPLSRISTSQICVLMLFAKFSGFTVIFNKSHIGTHMRNLDGVLKVVIINIDTTTISTTTTTT